MTGRERVLRALHGETTDALPNIAITMMKAADAVGVPYRRYATDAGAHARGQIEIKRMLRRHSTRRTRSWRSPRGFRRCTSLIPIQLRA